MNKKNSKTAYNLVWQPLNRAAKKVTTLTSGFTALALSATLLVPAVMAKTMPRAEFVVHNSKADQSLIKQTFAEQGFVVVDGVSSSEEREELASLVRELSATNPRASTAGFFDLYHDNTLAQIRQNPNLHNTFATLFDDHKLWVVFDRIIHMTEENREERLPLHVDQNPFQHPDFSLTQGLMALTDINEETGMLALIPKSHLWFHRYRAWSNPQQGWIAYEGDDEPEMRELLRSIPLKPGELVIWDSRVTHSRANSVAPEGESKERMLMMISFQPASNDWKLKKARLDAYREGVGVYNHDAGLRNTAGGWEGSLRKNREVLSDLGRKLYGIDSWERSTSSEL